MWTAGNIAVGLVCGGLPIANRSMSRISLLPMGTGSSPVPPSLFTGFWLAAGNWGITKHYWVIAKWVGTIAAILFGGTVLDRWVDASFRAVSSAGEPLQNPDFQLSWIQLCDRFGRRPLLSGHLLSQTLGEKKLSRYGLRKSADILKQGRIWEDRTAEENRGTPGGGCPCSFLLFLLDSFSGFC